MIYRILRLGGGCCAAQCPGVKISFIAESKKVVGSEMFEQKMESLTVVVVTKVAELMQKDIVTKRGRQTDDVQIEIDIVSGRAAAPVGGVVLDGHPIVCKSIFFGKLRQTGRKFGFGLPSRGLDLLRGRFRNILVAFFLPGYGLKNPFPLESEESQCCRIGHKIRHGDTYPLERMYPDTHPADSFAFPQDYVAKLRI